MTHAPACLTISCLPFQMEELLDILEKHLHLEWEVEEACGETTSSWPLPSRQDLLA